MRVRVEKSHFGAGEEATVEGEALSQRGLVIIVIVVIIVPLPTSAVGTTFAERVAPT